jgi:hypothetical protein
LGLAIDWIYVGFWTNFAVPNAHASGPKKVGKNLDLSWFGCYNYKGKFGKSCILTTPSWCFHYYVLGITDFRFHK